MHKHEKLPPTSDMLDRSLLKRVLNCDKGAMRRLFDRHAKTAYSVAMHILQDSHSAETVMHDIFVQIWREPAAFLEAGGSLIGAIVMLSRHRSVERLRGVSRKPLGVPTVPSLFDEDEMPQSSELFLLGKGKGRTQLPTEQSGTLDLAFFKGLTLAEIADVTGSSPAVVGALLNSALSNLRTARKARSGNVPVSAVS